MPVQCVHGPGCPRCKRSFIHTIALGEQCWDLGKCIRLCSTCVELDTKANSDLPNQPLLFRLPLV